MPLCNVSEILNNFLFKEFGVALAEGSHQQPLKQFDVLKSETDEVRIIVSKIVGISWQLESGELAGPVCEGS